MTGEAERKGKASAKRTWEATQEGREAGDANGEVSPRYPIPQKQKQIRCGLDALRTA
ncbi:hypothetical protein FA13DRAFT_1731287 [Coprinellus micaceus]|uniref:Uncharacterized protein n=1 Tax=Coprinellus micaceus TaxID=71717 RepID=A0A4Y7TF50_COPMI|nr:hypothetical protein FA13DRAFT_1731287 [Coprinellus micaceus]